MYVMYYVFAQYFFGSQPMPQRIATKFALEFDAESSAKTHFRKFSPSLKMCIAYFTIPDRFSIGFVQPLLSLATGFKQNKESKQTTVGIKCVFCGGQHSRQSYRIIATRLVFFLFNTYFNGPVGDQLSQIVLDRSSPNLQDRLICGLGMIDLTFVFRSIN